MLEVSVHYIYVDVSSYSQLTQSILLQCVRQLEQNSRLLLSPEGMDLLRTKCWPHANMSFQCRMTDR